MKSRFQRWAILLMAAWMLTLALPGFTLAQENADAGEKVVVSNTLSIEDVAVLATEVEDTEAEVPEGATRVRLEWLPDAANAPESATVLIIGSGTPEKLVLTAENGWQKTVKLVSSTIPYSVTLLKQSNYSVDRAEGSIVITATLDVDDPLTVVEGGKEIGEEETPDDTKDYGVSITASVSPTDVLTYGMQITLTAVPAGYEDVEYTLVWQCNKGSGWEAMEGVTGPTYAFTLTEENASWAYRVEVVPAE